MDLIVGVKGKTLKNVLCAPDSFKETLTAARVAEALAAGVSRAEARLSCDRCPVADGGEGSLEVLSAALGGSLHRMAVTGPLGEPVHARFGVTGDGRTGLVELAEASGLALAEPARRDPTRTTSRGTGELIAAAWDRGCRTVIVCLGGSATVDAGTGIVQALGGRFVDRDGCTIETPLTGAGLGAIAGFRPPPAASVPRLRIACDVTNPLLGDTGAAACYGPQKGATARQVEALEAELTRLAALLGGDPGQAGAGAAGGAGWGLATMLGAVLEPGIDLVLEAVAFESRCAVADLVLTGEGRLDASSRRGKACAEVARRVRGLGVPVVAVVGAVAPGEDFDDLFDQVISLSERYGVERAMAEPESLLAEVAAEVVARVARSTER